MIKIFKTSGTLLRNGSYNKKKNKGIEWRNGPNNVCTCEQMNKKKKKTE
jgi:hypothetical protein